MANKLNIRVFYLAEDGTNSSQNVLAYVVTDTPVTDMSVAIHKIRF